MSKPYTPQISLVDFLSVFPPGIYLAFSVTILVGSVVGGVPPVRIWRWLRDLSGPGTWFLSVFVILGAYVAGTVIRGVPVNSIEERFCNPRKRFLRKVRLLWVAVPKGFLSPRKWFPRKQRTLRPPRRWPRRIYILCSLFPRDTRSKRTFPERNRRADFPYFSILLENQEEVSKCRSLLKEPLAEVNKLLEQLNKSYAEVNKPLAEMNKLLKVTKLCPMVFFDYMKMFLCTHCPEAFAYTQSLEARVRFAAGMLLAAIVSIWLMIAAVFLTIITHLFFGRPWSSEWSWAVALLIGLSVAVRMILGASISRIRFEEANQVFLAYLAHCSREEQHSLTGETDSGNQQSDG